MQDGVNGLVLKENTEDALVSAIQRLDENWEVLEMFTHNHILSVEKFYIDNYMDDIIASLSGRKHELTRLYSGGIIILQSPFKEVAMG